ncbi:MAG: retroviral-like aspartic protease family protein [Thermoanaerobaculia bacterium]
MRKLGRLLSGLLLLSLTGCALYSDVTINPLYMTPDNAHRPTGNVTDLYEQGDYARAAAYSTWVDGRKPTAHELMAVGQAELACGRLDAARRHLRSAFDLKPFHTEAAELAWNLSQVEYLANNYGASLEWAKVAESNGMDIKNWHLEFLDALSEVRTNAPSGSVTARRPLIMGEPDVPRLKVNVNGEHEAVAVIDTGAVLSIISETLASRIGIRRIGDIKGEFFGLLGEPITVRFGLLDTLAFGDLKMGNVPVAIMPDVKMTFFVHNREKFNMDLLLGANLLKHFRLELDYRKEEVEFTVTARNDAAISDEQNLFLVGFRPFVHATINKRGWYPFILDTGSEITFLNENLIANTSIRSLPRLHGALLQGLGGSQKRGAKIKDVEIGVDQWAGKFKTLPLYSTEQTNAVGIVGQNFLKNFRVVIDFAAMKMELHRK